MEITPTQAAHMAAQIFRAGIVPTVMETAVERIIMIGSTRCSTANDVHRWLDIFGVGFHYPGEPTKDPKTQIVRIIHGVLEGGDEGPVSRSEEGGKAVKKAAVAFREGMDRVLEEFQGQLIKILEDADVRTQNPKNQGTGGGK